MASHSPHRAQRAVLHRALFEHGPGPCRPVQIPWRSVLSKRDEEIRPIPSFCTGRLPRQDGRLGRDLPRGRPTGTVDGGHRVVGAARRQARGAGTGGRLSPVLRRTRKRALIRALSPPARKLPSGHTSRWRLSRYGHSYHRVFPMVLQFCCAEFIPSPGVILLSWIVV